MIKSISLNVKDIDLGKREAVLAHATYNSLDRDQDRANRGMFDKSWKEKFADLRYFLNHDRKQAPGKPLRCWDDSDHAYTQVKHGTHTLGEDTLKMLDEGIIVAVSYGFDPVKQKKIPNKGYDYLEVMHGETSVLTHWGSHPVSGIVSVTKEYDGPALQLKQLSASEQALLRKLINSGMDNIQSCLDLAISLTPESDLYTAIQYYITRQSDQLSDLKSSLRYGLKEAEALTTRVKQLQKFIRNTTASDDTIRMVEKSLNKLLNKPDTANTESAMRECPKCKTQSVCTPDEYGNTKCAQCNHVLKSSQPNASSDKSEQLRRKLLLLNTKFI